MAAEPTKFPVSIQTVSHVVPNAEIYFPRVWGMRNTGVQEQINRTIVGQVNALMAEQRKYQVPGQTTMTGYYEMKTNERGVLSLTQNNYAYTPPMAHGMTLLKSLTFDVQTGKTYALSELFRPGTNYAARISDTVRAQIKERDIPLLGEFTGISPDQDYYIADKALVVYFQLYEITPYVYGFPMFPISVYSLQDIVDEEGPLGKMLPGL
ncbi:DUF3298 and DUF4163 domain-containing protein [Paenibacillus alkalitolerans]|uniref:DUF3298 and DUF4163 domain-containing protein n=1 Tax=Paenibacillus alkalitolerans TaxID=2799335 RepID=UPI0018F6147B|nr:DUF3298 and DUF4163 domain-containing protein [Paenibacillus alkalitolerans]